MRRRLYTSNNIGMAGYLMDFGFGGFIGYGKGVSCCEGEEELMRRMMYDEALKVADVGDSARSCIYSYPKKTLAILDLINDREKTIEVCKA